MMPWVALRNTAGTSAGRNTAEAPGARRPRSPDWPRGSAPVPRRVPWPACATWPSASCVSTAGATSPQRCAATPVTPPESCHCLVSPAHTASSADRPVDRRPVGHNQGASRARLGVGCGPGRKGEGPERTSSTGPKQRAALAGATASTTSWRWRSLPGTAAALDPRPAVFARRRCPWLPDA